jgi:hypothetical protein
VNYEGILLWQKIYSQVDEHATCWGLAQMRIPAAWAAAAPGALQDARIRALEAGSTSSSKQQQRVVKALAVQHLLQFLCAGRKALRHIVSVQQPYTSVAICMGAHCQNVPEAPRCQKIALARNFGILPFSTEHHGELYCRSAAFGAHLTYPVCAK